MKSSPVLVAILVEWRIDAQDYVAKQREKANVVRNRMVPSGSYCFLPASGQLPSMEPLRDESCQTRTDCYDF